MPIFPMTTARSVRLALLARTEIALLDVRPESRFAQGHPLFAASFPLGHLEAQAAWRLPRRSVPIVVYGDGADDAAAAAGRLGELGYTGVSLLAGGLAGWAADGGELFRDVNAPSKAFGELVAETAGTPSLAADEVAALLRGAGAGVVVVDARRFDEYATMSIPTAISVPGAELALRVRALAPEPGITVVVNCAGRTRSIIGAQSLINAGLPNRVAALRNGTIGWTLAGFDLDRGRARRAPDVSPETAAEAEAAAWAVADRAGVRRVGGGEPAGGRDEERTVYRFDVRTPDEYDHGHRAGFRSAPGGQLIQETDWYAPVRGALVILDGDGGGRAAMTASWLAQMGWDVAVDVGGDGSTDAAAGSTDAAAAAAAERPAAPGPGEMLSPALDVYRRPYEGTDVDPAVMQAYLDWEYGLVGQLERDGTHGFWVLTTPPAAGSAG
jgi:rhodanese-related sulfurtransferase